MKKNWFSIITYASVVLIFLALIIILEQPFLLIFALPLIAVPFVSTALFTAAIRGISFHAYGKTSSVELGNIVHYILEAKNTSFIPLFYCTVVFHMENLFFPNNRVQHLSIPLSAKKTGTFDIPAETTLPGMLVFTVSAVRISDYLHFCTIEIPQTIRVQIPIFPLPAKTELPDTTASAEGEEEIEDTSLRGMPSSEIKEIREYRPGDRLQRIHWKLSAKLDDLFVKELSNTSVLSMVILPELSKNCISDTLSLLRSVAELLVSQEQYFELCLYNHNDCSFEFFLISNQDEMADCFVRLYYLPLYEGKECALDAFLASNQHGSSLIRICGTTAERIELESHIY